MVRSISSGRSDREGEVVDQAGAADLGGDEDAGLGAGWYVARQLAEVGVGDHEVVEVDDVGGAELGPRRSQGCVHAPLGVHLRGAQGPAERDRLEPLVGVEVAVAAGEREAVRLALGLGADDLDAEAEVVDHPADQHQLLVVLLAEHGEVRADQPEQLGHHGEHTAEVAGPGLPLEDRAQRARARR